MDPLRQSLVAVAPGELAASRHVIADVAGRVKHNLLDLLPIAYESVALPTSSYSLKQVEGLVGFA